MNRRLDNVRLTTEDLRAIARERCGLTDTELDVQLANKHGGLAHSRLLELTCEKRFEMFMAGELVLDTRPDDEVRATGCHGCSPVRCACRSRG